MNDQPTPTIPGPPPSEQPTQPLAHPLPSDEATLPPSIPPGPNASPPPPISTPAFHGDTRAPAGYIIEAELGRGGMGVVYKALSLALQRPCALKVILSGVHSGNEEVERVRTEAQAIARLQHPGIV
jgi:hypothetical protein